MGSTSCQIVRRLEEVSSGWSFSDRKSLGFLYMDTREATRGEISRSARFIPLTLPHFSNLRDMRPWITECVPELKYLSLSREGALGTLANAGVAARFNYGNIRGHVDSTIEQVCPYYEGLTYLRIHVVSFLGGGTSGALPVLLAALSEARGTAYNFSVVLHLIMPQRGMSRDPESTLSEALQFLRSATGVKVGKGEYTGKDSFTITVYPDKRVEAWAALRLHLIMPQRGMSRGPVRLHHFPRGWIAGRILRSDGKAISSTPMAQPAVGGKKWHDSGSNESIFHSTECLTGSHLPWTRWTF